MITPIHPHLDEWVKFDSYLSPFPIHLPFPGPGEPSFGKARTIECAFFCYDTDRDLNSCFCMMQLTFFIYSASGYLCFQVPYKMSCDISRNSVKSNRQAHTMGSPVRICFVRMAGHARSIPNVDQ